MSDETKTQAEPADANDKEENMAYSDEPDDFRARLRTELRELRGRVMKLQAFGLSDEYARLQMDERARLGEQLEHMQAYEAVLAERAQALGFDDA